MNRAETKTIDDRRVLPDRRVFDYLNSSSLSPEDRRRYDRRTSRRRKLISTRRREAS